MQCGYCGINGANTVTGLGIIACSSCASVVDDDNDFDENDYHNVDYQQDNDYVITMKNNFV